MMSVTAIQARARAILSRQQAESVVVPRSVWTADGGRYVNSETGRAYTPHHDDERRFVFADAPRRALAKGGEGGGKSVAGIIKDLERLRKGMHGIMGSPDFEHFKRSLWPEFARWCPWQHVIAEQRYRGRVGWEPSKPFALTFTSGGTLLCGGFDEPGSWEGPNVHFAHFDEPKRHKTPAMLKVLDGRCRLIGPHGEASQLWFTTTPRKNWLYDYFGPWERDGTDPLAAFKQDILVIDLLTEDNERAGNLASGFTAKRRQSLTEAEARVLLEAAWEETDVTERFLPSMHWWDSCQEVLPVLDARTPLVLALDAGEVSDTFAAVAVSAHPDPARKGDLAVRWVRCWVPPGNGQALDFNAIEGELRDFIRSHRVLQLCYDRYQLRQMTQSLSSIVWCEEFSQAGDRLVADKSLLDAIRTRHLAHDGDPTLREHVANADRKIEGENKLRIVKRTASLKIDAIIACSMGHARAINEFRL